MFDLRCLSLTVQRHTAAHPEPVKLHHITKCHCQADMTIVHKSVVVINPLGNPTHCPCGLPQHKGMCSDALREAQGLEPIKWHP